MTGLMRLFFRAGLAFARAPLAPLPRRLPQNPNASVACANFFLGSLVCGMRSGASVARFFGASSLGGSFAPRSGSFSPPPPSAAVRFLPARRPFAAPFAPFRAFPRRTPARPSPPPPPRRRPRRIRVGLAAVLAFVAPPPAPFHRARVAHVARAKRSAAQSPPKPP